ncbi:MAG: DUF309 domain-containing protein [Thermodesulfobacteriota bacterium]|nr:DUF309 domain-containing protein [Thermodesulfobacteriota bacterium]
MKFKVVESAMLRYTNRPLPEYRHLPFRNAHPFLDEDGHSFGEKLSPPDSFTAENWQSCEDYLYSIDLFNHGFWWEAHERLKYVSIGAGRESEAGQFVQGLIQVAAALLKHFMVEDKGAATLMELGLGNLQKMKGVYLGIEVSTLVVQVPNCLKTNDSKYPQIYLQQITPSF